MIKLQEFENYLSNRDYTQEDWENIVDIYGEYLLEDSDLYVFKHHFGLGKTTFGLMMLEEGDIFLQETYDQLKDNIEHFEALRPNDSTEIIFGWNTFIGLDDNTSKFQELKDLQTNYPQRINKLQKLTEKHNGKYARMKIRVMENNTPILDKYANQFNSSTWRNNIIFACTKKIDLIEQKSFLKSAERIVIDEGVEFTFSSGEIEDIQEALLDLGQKNPSRTTLSNQNTQATDTAKDKKRKHLKNQTLNKLVQAQDLQELLSKSPQFINWNWCRKLSNKEMKKLGKLGRESLLGILHSGYSDDLSEGNEKAKLIRSERGPHIHTTHWGLGNFNPLKEFGKVWRNIAKKKRGGIDLSHYQNIGTDHYPGDYSKFEKELWIQALQGNWKEVQKLQEFHRIAEFLHNIENLHVIGIPDGKTQEINKIRYDIPLMFKLFDINEENDQDILILDATTDEYYLEWIKRRWRNYYRDTTSKYSTGPEDKDINFLGENKDYQTLSPEDTADEVRRYYWDFNKKKETITRSLVKDNFRKFKLLVDLIKRKDQEDTAIISTKGFWRDFKTDDRVEKGSYFAISTGQNWNNIEKTYVFGRPTKPWYIYEKDFMKQYREYRSFDHKNFRKGEIRNEILKPKEWIVEGRVSGHVTRWFHRRERKIYNYWERNLQKPVFDSYFRMRGGKRLNVIGFDRFNWIGGKSKENNHYPISDLYAELMDEKYIIQNWETISDIFPISFFTQYFNNIVTKKGSLRKPFRKYKEWINQEMNVEEGLKNEAGSQSTYYRWKKKYEKHDLV